MPGHNEGEMDWMKAIKSDTICTFFYILFVVNVIIAVFTVSALGFTVLTFKGPKTGVISQALFSLALIALASTQALFFYIMCHRSIGGQDETHNERSQYPALPASPPFSPGSDGF